MNLEQGDFVKKLRQLYEASELEIEPYGFFSRFLNCRNDTKSRKAPHI